MLNGICIFPKRENYWEIQIIFFISAVRGKGDPNEEGGEYPSAIGVLYAVAYTLKMSYKTDYRIKGFYDYVVPPLEGFWWQEGVDGIDYSDKSTFCWISVIRLPDFITKKDFDWAVKTATKKKKLDCSKAEFLTIAKGLCVQIMHMLEQMGREKEQIAALCSEMEKAREIQALRGLLDGVFDSSETELYKNLGFTEDNRYRVALIKPVRGEDDERKAVALMTTEKFLSVQATTSERNHGAQQRILSDQEPASYYYPQEWELQLASALRDGHTDIAKRIIRELRRENEHRAPPQKQKAALLEVLWERIIRTVNSSNMDVSVDATQHGFWEGLEDACKSIHIADTEQRKNELNMRIVQYLFFERSTKLTGNNLGRWFVERKAA